MLLRLLPCTVLFLLSPAELWCKRRHPDSGAWRPVNVARLLVCLLTAILQLTAFLYYMVDNRWEQKPLVTSLTPLLLTIAYIWSAILLLTAKIRGECRASSLMRSSTV